MVSSTETEFARIEAHQVTKHYHHQPVLNALSLTVDDGQLCILVGANGAGKTTLLRIIASLTRADAGEIVLGEAADTLSRRTLGYVGHQPMLYMDLSAAENLRHYARLYNIPDQDAAVEISIRTAGLEHHQDKPVRTLSRGMQQRLSIARALLHKPSILLLDEPYTGLDQDAARFLDETLRSLRRPGQATLLAAHRPQRLLPIASQIAWLKNGKIVQHLPVERLSESPELEDYLQEIS